MFFLVLYRFMAPYARPQLLVLQSRTSRGPRSPQACTFDYTSTNRLHPGGELCRRRSPSRLLPVPGRAGQVGHMNASEGLESTAALAPSSPTPLSLRCMVVRLLFCFKAPASAWPGWVGRPHMQARAPKENGSLGTIITDAIPDELDRSEAAVLL